MLRATRSATWAAALAMAMALALSAPVQAVQWTASSATAPGLDALAPSLAYDPSGSLHLAYIHPYGTARGLYHGTNATGSWQFTKIAGLSSIGNEEWTSLAVDHLGKVHIAYQKQNAGVYYVTNRSGSWSRKLIRSSGSFLVYPEIAVDALRKVHLVYFVPSPASPGLRYTTNRSGTWATKRITKSAFDLRADLALDSARRVHVIVGRSNYGYRYLTNKSGVWKGEKLRDGLTFTRSPSIAVDAAGRPRVAFGSYGTQLPSLNGTWQGVRTASGWQVTQLTESVAIATQVRLAPDGSVHVGAFGASHWSNESGAWQGTATASDVAPDARFKTAFAVSSGGNLAFAYMRADGSIGLATRGAWDGNLGP